MHPEINTMTTKVINNSYAGIKLKANWTQPNEDPIKLALGFCGIAGVIVIATFLIAGVNKKLSFGQRLMTCWFMISGCIHLIVEGYFATFHESVMQNNDYLAQIWKEYGFGDSRYLVSDSFLVPMESITAFFDGPICLIIAFILITGKLTSFRHPLTVIVCICQLYGDVCYYWTEAMENFTHITLTNWRYYWLYFAFSNSLWILIPSILAISSFFHIAKSLKKN